MTDPAGSAFSSECARKRLLITASREWKDIALMRMGFSLAVLLFNVPPALITVVHGNARGGDRMAEGIAIVYGMGYERNPVTSEQWRRDSRNAGHNRNGVMIAKGADLVLAFALSWWSGTGNCARQARQARLTVVDFGVMTGREMRPATRNDPGVPAALFRGPVVVSANRTSGGLSPL